MKLIVSNISRIIQKGLVRLLYIVNSFISNKDKDDDFEDFDDHQTYGTEFTVIDKKNFN